MRTLIVGVGALGGVIAARLCAAAATRAAGGADAGVWLATRGAATAALLRRAGLRVDGVGGAVSVGGGDFGGIAALGEYGSGDLFDLIVLATKAREAIEAAPRVARMLASGGTLLPIQNGGVPRMLAEGLGPERVLGGLSNLGATMVEPGVYEQRNAGHLLIGELGGRGAESGRGERVRAWLGRGVEVRVTPNMEGAVWSKLMLNCSVTTIGAIAGTTMRGYIGLPDGRALFDLAYDEALRVAIATGARPERMIVDPFPPGWDGDGDGTSPAERDAWIGQILAAYGSLKPSMLQDFERGRPTEIDFINGYVADVGRAAGVATPINAAIVDVVRAISRGDVSPGPENLGRVLRGRD